MKPFCIGHWLLCNRFGISFVTSAGEHGLGDLLLGVLICSSTVDEFNRMLAGPGLEKAMARWRWKLAGGRWGALRRLWRKPGSLAELVGFDFAAECDRFQTYLDEHGAGQVRVNDWSIPCTQAKEGSMRTVRSPAPILILCALISELRLGFSESLNLPLPFARWLVAVQAERIGAVTVVDRDELAAEQDLANKVAADAFAT